jgi:hypothetical protein
MARKKTKPKDSFDESELPAEGAVFAFQLSDGRWGACRVLRKLPIAKTELGEWSSKKVDGWCLRVAVTPWVGKKLPQLKDLLLREILTLTHHSWTGRKEVALIACPPDGEFQCVGVLPTTDKDRRQQETSLSFGEWPREMWAQQILMQWEWDHSDRQKLLAREQQQKQQASTKADQAEARRIARLRKMSLAEFRRSKFCPRWSMIAPTAAVADTRQSIDACLGRLIALGKNPPRKQVLAEIKRLIQQWNKVNRKHGQFMQTIERDDLTTHLADLLIVAGLDDDAVVLFERWEDL